MIVDVLIVENSVVVQVDGRQIAVRDLHGDDVGIAERVADHVVAIFAIEGRLPSGADSFGEMHEVVLATALRRLLGRAHVA